MKVMVINGSVREGRVADKVQDWAVGLLKEDSELELDVVDLKEVDLPFFNEAVIPSAAKGQFQNPKGTAWAQRVAEADAFVMITPEYNYGTSAVLKNAIDWVYEGWQNKPVGFISYGGVAAGTRAVQQLRQNISNVGLFSVAVAVHIPFVSRAFDDNGQPIAPGLSDSLRNMVTGLKDLQRRLKG